MKRNEINERQRVTKRIEYKTERKTNIYYRIFVIKISCSSRSYGKTHTQKFKMFTDATRITYFEYIGKT